MKTILTALAAALFLLPPISSFAGYVIHLKDGTKFVTDQYVEEGDQIKFKRYGGLIGVEKDRVRNIEKINDPPEKSQEPADAAVPTAGGEAETKQTPKAGTSKPETVEPPGTGKEPKAEARAEEKEAERPLEVSEEEMKKAEQDKAAEIQAFLEEKREIMREMDSVTLKLQEARERANKSERRKLLTERTNLLARLSELEQSVRATNGGKLPDWWGSDL